MHSDLPHSPAAERNQGVILAALTEWLGAQARVLEVASGTGQHAAHLAAARPAWRWQPSDRSDATLPAVAARCAGLANVAAPQVLDLLDQATWPAAADAPDAPDADVAEAGFDAIYTANVLHIAPWPVCAALMRLAATRLRPGGQLLVYGPFVIDAAPDQAAEPTAPSNLAFDADLRQRDPAWGLRALSAVRQAAADAGLVWCGRRPMPANNQFLRWQRPG